VAISSQRAARGTSLAGYDDRAFFTGADAALGGRQLSAMLRLGVAGSIDGGGAAALPARVLDGDAGASPDPARIVFDPLLTPMADIAPDASFGSTIVKTGSAFQVNAAGPSARNVSIAAAGDGGWVVIWQAVDGFGNDGIFRKTFDANAVPIGGEARVNTTVVGSQQNAQVSSVAGGGYAVAWMSYNGQGDGDGAGIYARLFNAAGPVGNEFLVNVTIAGDQTTANIAGLSSGGFVVTWLSNGHPYMRVYDASGAPAGGEMAEVQTGTPDDVAGLSNGGFVLTWHEANHVYARIYDASAAPQGGVVDVGIHNPTGTPSASVAGLAGGGFVVSWQFSPGSTNDDIFARVYDSSFAPVGSQFRVNETLPNAQEASSVTALPAGGFVIAWQSFTNGSLNYDIFARQYGADGTPATGELSVVNDSNPEKHPGVAAVADGYVVVWDGSTFPSSNMAGQVYAPGHVYQATEQVGTDLKGPISVSDADAGSDIVTATLSVDFGILNVTAGSSGATVMNSGTATVTIQGTIAQINALLGSDPTSTVSYVANSDTPPVLANMTLTIDDGTLSDTARATIQIAAVDDATVAFNDTMGPVQENATVNLNVMANDIDPDGGPVHVYQINSTGVVYGQSVIISSGAIVTLEANGTVTYDPSGAFNYLTAGATATDGFTYTAFGGSVARVTVTITGVTSSDDPILGDSGDNTLGGTALRDYFDLSQGGNDTANGFGSDDAFYFGAAFTAADHVDGGAGTNDQIGLKGDYAGGNALVLGTSTIVNVEAIVVLPGFSYDITTRDDNVAPGGLLKVQATQLAAGQSLHFDGSAEQNGSFLVYGGQGDDVMIGGHKDDGFYFGPGAFNSSDSVDGGPGTNDQLGLDGDYGSVGTPFVLGGNITNVEAVVFLVGPEDDHNSFVVTTDDSLVAAGSSMAIFGLFVLTNISFDGSNELDGAFRIYGGFGNDSLTGSAGNDWIFGGRGGDTLTGGAGTDTFYYDDVIQSTPAASDQITDFASGEKVDVSGIDAVAGGSDNAFTFLGAGAFTNHAGELRAVNQGGSTWLVQGDTNGDGVADLQLTLITSDAHPITSADFTL